MNKGIIDDEIYDISQNINDELFEMINGPEWNIHLVGKSKRWNRVFENIRKLDGLIREKWIDQEIEYLKTM